MLRCRTAKRTAAARGVTPSWCLRFGNATTPEDRCSVVVAMCWSNTCTSSYRWDNLEYNHRATKYSLHHHCRPLVRHSSTRALLPRSPPSRSYAPSLISHLQSCPHHATQSSRDAMPIAVTHGPSGANSCLATHSTACARPRAHQQRIPALRCHARDAPPTLELEGTSIGHPTLLHTAWWRFGHWLHTHYFHQQTLGGHNLPPGGLFVLASNHASHLDCSSVFTAAQRSGCEQTYALGARDYFFVNAFVVCCCCERST